MDNIHIYRRYNLRDYYIELLLYCRVDIRLLDLRGSSNSRRHTRISGRKNRARIGICRTCRFRDRNIEERFQYSPENRQDNNQHATLISFLGRGVQIENMTFVKRNIASLLTASLLDTAVKIICAQAQARATPEKGDSQRVAKWPIVEYQSLVLTSFSGCLLVEAFTMTVRRLLSLFLFS